VKQLPKEKKVPAVQTFQIPNSTNMAATRAINETILSSGQTKNGPQDRFVYQPSCLIFIFRQNLFFLNQI
jgi:hypothetical protein